MNTKRLWKYTITLMTGLLASSFLLAQEATFEAYADAKQVVLNSYFEVTFTLKNGDGSNFRAPSFDNFNVLSGPARSVSTTIINGAVSKELSYSYTLLANLQATLTPVPGPATPVTPPNHLEVAFALPLATRIGQTGSFGFRLSWEEDGNPFTRAFIVPVQPGDTAHDIASYLEAEFLAQLPGAELT